MEAEGLCVSTVDATPVNSRCADSSGFLGESLSESKSNTEESKGRLHQEREALEDSAVRSGLGLLSQGPPGPPDGGRDLGGRGWASLCCEGSQMARCDCPLAAPEL